MNSILFDTDVIIDILRNKRETIDQISILARDKELCCSCITVGEIFAGMHRKEEKPTKHLLNSMKKIPVTDEIAEFAGRLKYETKTHTLWLDDCFIAATALLHNCLLLTKNTKHYPFKKLELVKIT